MSRIGIVNPETLVGAELKETLERRRELWSSLVLLTSGAERVGTLTDAAGEAGFLRDTSLDSLDGLDLVFVCSEGEPVADLLPAVPAGLTTVLMADAPVAARATPLVAGVNLERAEAGTTLASPHPGVVALATLLHPLAPFAPRQATAWLVAPTSQRGRPALDELFAQTGSILNFQTDFPRQVFGRQLAFNLLPLTTDTAGLADDLAAVLGSDFRAALQAVQGPVFHSFSVSARVELAADPGPEAVGDALAAAPFVEIADEPEALGPIDAAAHDNVLVGRIAADPGYPGAYWIWAVLDNLTRGGAANAVAIAEALLAPAQ